MRPIMLDLHGFASFRDEAHVDFSDADFFALVGPTGSGKSTVIDAMTFALYGSVPRWGRKGMVSLALAPTVARGTVKLVFEVDGPALRGGPRAAPRRRHGQPARRQPGTARRPARPRQARRPDLPHGQGPRRRQRRRREAARPEVRGLRRVRGAAAGPVRRLPARQAERTAGHPAAPARRRALPADDGEGEPAGQRGRAAREHLRRGTARLRRRHPRGGAAARAPPRPPWPASASG